MAERAGNSAMIYTGDCLEVLASIEKRDAWAIDTPANIGFMGRKWDRHLAECGFVPPIPPRSNAHLRELQSEHAFQRYWGERFGMAYDLSEDDAVAIVWALPRTTMLTGTALRWAGWRILDVATHLFGQGWPKNGTHLKPASEHWFIALKGHAELAIDACRVPRGESAVRTHNGTLGYGGSNAPAGINGGNPLGSHPANVVISHHPACVRIGVKRIGAGQGRHPRAAQPGKQVTHGSFTTNAVFDYGTESVPAYSCVASCPCGKWWNEPSGGSPSRCECGRQGEWVCPSATIDEQTGNRPGMSGGGKHRDGARGGMFGAIDCESTTYADQGGGSRFFNNFAYFAKASGRINDKQLRRLQTLNKRLDKAKDEHVRAKLQRQIEAQERLVEIADNGVPTGERHAGCENLYWRANKKNPFGFDQVTREEWNNIVPDKMHEDCLHATERQNRIGKAQGNVHSTVKGIQQMLHWVRLSGGKKIGDICAGSGGTAIACDLLGLDFVGAELCPEAVEIAEARRAFWRGLSMAALDAFLLTGELPKRAASNPQNLSLFGG